MKIALPMTTVSMLLSASVVMAEPVTLEAQPQRISMFKNGLAMVSTRTQVPKAGTYQIATPEARYGSLWIAWEPGLKLDQIISREVNTEERAPVLSVEDVLRANTGKSISIKLRGADAWAKGILLEIPVPDEELDEDNPNFWDPSSGDLLLFRTEQGVIALDPDRVEQARFEDDDPATILSTQDTTQMLAFEARSGEGEGRSVALSYLISGIAWSPSYTINLSDEETAQIACKAVIVNDLMDISACEVELIAGFPNLKFAGVPTALGPTPLDRLLSTLVQAEEEGQSGSRMMLQQALSNTSAGAGFGLYGDDTAYDDYVSIDAPLQGEGAEDLYFYQLPDVTLAKGERGYFPMFKADVPYRHIYTWDITDFIDRYDRYEPQPEDSRQIVWHSLELTNTTKQPWTTASGMTVVDGRVLGQDVLRYTPPKGTTLMKITQAVSINTEQNEVEIERERNAVTFHGSTYDKVTVEGKLSITNFKDKAVTLKINKLVSGEVESAEANPKIVKIASGLNRVNPRSKLTWEAEIEPGKDNAVTITYRYSFYTR